MEKAMAPHSSTLAWKILWMEEPGGLQSMGSLRVGHSWVTSLSLHFHALEKEIAAHSSVLAWRIPGMGEPGGLQSTGSQRVEHNWSDLAAAAASCIQLCDPMDCSSPGSSVHGLLPGKTEEGIHRAWTPSEACLCWLSSATSPVDSELPA